MGAWGEDLLDNDDALDTVADWDEFVAPYIASAGWGTDRVWAFFRRIYFREGLPTDDSDFNRQLLAVGVLFQRHGLLPLPTELVSLLEEAVDTELAPDALAEWSAPRKRKKALIDFLASFGGQRKAIPKVGPSTLLSLPAADELRPFALRLPEWARVVSPPSSNADFERLYPALFNQIERVLTQGLKRSTMYVGADAELLKLRFMLLCFYAGWKAKLAPEQIDDLVAAAERTQGGFFLALGLTTGK